jgi:outer membrane protein assembly factor BamB
MRTVLIAVLLLPVAGCAWFSSKSVEEPTPLQKIKHAPRVKVLWDRDTGKGTNKLFLRLSPAHDGERIIATDAKGRVIAYKAGNGRKLWLRKLKSPVTAGVAVAGSRVIVPTSDGELRALDAATGKVIWQTFVNAEVLAAAAIADDIAVVQGVDGRVTALSVTDGTILWTQERAEPPLSLRGVAGPRIAGAHVLAGYASGKLVAYKLSDGSQEWEAVVGQPRGRSEIERLIDVDASFALDADTIYAAAYQGSLAAVDIDTGRVRWSREVSSYTGIAAGDGRLYLSDDQGIVIALAAATGEPVWRQEGLRYRGTTAPALSGEYVVVGDSEGYVHWLASTDGHFVARKHATGDAYLAAPVVVDSTVYLAASNGDVDALRLSN